MSRYKKITSAILVAVVAATGAVAMTSCGEQQSSIGTADTTSEQSSDVLDNNSKTSESSQENVVNKYEQEAMNVQAQYISSKVLSAKEAGISNSSDEKYTVITYAVSSPSDNNSTIDNMSTYNYAKTYGKDGTKLTSLNSTYTLSDNSVVYIETVKGEYNIDDIDIKIYDSYDEKAYDIKEFNRTPAELTYASGNVVPGDIVKIKGNPYIYVGVSSKSSGKSSSDSSEKSYEEFYHSFVSLTSENERHLSEDIFTFDKSATESLSKSEYPIEPTFQVNDKVTLDKVSKTSVKELSEGCRIEVAMLLPKDSNIDNMSELVKKDLIPYIKALRLVYDDSDSDYKFSICANGSDK